MAKYIIMRILYILIDYYRLDRERPAPPASSFRQVPVQEIQRAPVGKLRRTGIEGRSALHVEPVVQPRIDVDFRVPVARLETSCQICHIGNTAVGRSLWVTCDDSAAPLPSGRFRSI